MSSTSGKTAEIIIVDTKSITFNTKFIIFNTQFLAFDTKRLVLLQNSSFNQNKCDIRTLTERQARCGIARIVDLFELQKHTILNAEPTSLNAKFSAEDADDSDCADER